MKTKKYLFLLLMPFALIFCNKKTNPTEDYKNIKSVPRHDTPIQTKDFAASALSIHVPSSLTAPNPQFTEGIEGHIQFQVLHDPRIQDFTIEIMEGPGTITRNPTDKSLFDYKWTPPESFVSSGFGKVTQLTLIAKSLSSTQPRLAKASPPIPFPLVVTKVNESPKILGINGLSDDLGAITKLEAGTVTEFKVIVEDPAANEIRLPQIHDLPCNSVVRKDRHQYDGTAYVTPTASRSLGNSRFEISMKIDLQSLELPTVYVDGEKDVRAEDLDLCFELYAINLNTGLISPVQRRIVNALYKARKPIITLNDSEKIVFAGEKAGVDFSVEGLEYGEIEVTAKAENFPGPTFFDCKVPKTKTRDVVGNNRNRKNCRFEWEVPDDEQVLKGSYTLSVQAKHIVQRNGHDQPPIPENASATFRVKKLEPVSPKTGRRKK